MPALWLENLGLYSLQVALILAAGALGLQVLRIQAPVWRLQCWQVLLIVCLALPVLQTWKPVSDDVSVEISQGSMTTAGQRAKSAAAWPWRELLGALLFCGAALRVGLFGLGLLRLRAYRRRARPEPQAARELAARLRVRAEVRVSEEVPGPVTFGFFHPVVLLPERWIESEPVLFHELIHVRRRDWLCMAGEELLRAVLWFHPLIWYAIGQIQLAREEVVDREVVGLTQSREQYLETLLAIAAARSGLDLAPAPLFLRKRHLRKRVASLLREVKMSRVRLNVSLAGLLAFIAVTGWISVRSFPLQAAGQDAAKEPEKSGKHTTAIYKAPIVYPPDAKAAKIEGKVWLKIEIDRQGVVSNAYATSGPDELRGAALDSVRQWRFSTDAALPAQADVSVVFRLDDKAGANDQAAPATGQEGAPPSRIRVGGNVQSNNLIHKVTPVYPPEAKEARIQGVVRLSVLIAADGTVKEVEVMEGEPVLVDAAVPAVRQWVYRPTLLNGQPVEVSTVVDVNFTLSR